MNDKPYIGIAGAVDAFAVEYLANKMPSPIENPHTHTCDICGKPGTLTEATKCEAQGRTEPWPAGMVFRYKVPKDHPDYFNVAAIASVSDNGHSWDYKTWITSDRNRGPAGDFKKCYSRASYPMVALDTKSAAFVRMVAFLRKDRPGQPVYIWDGEKAVEWEGDLK